ncbi:unnamed protein product [Spirodela intermedia]|uniref:Uncharacterized protein n=1 Tax=Spirodela intermedia TaxID=51605 RepID=A0A811G6G9_SPIIN|nr:unnamed protein product [Spirodela intermedia]
MGCRLNSGSCHLVERKNGDFVALWRLSPDGEELDGAGWRWGACQGASSSGPRSKRRLFIASGTLSGVVSGGCHPAERKNGDFAALRRLSPDGEELDGGGARVRESFILRSAQQEEALHRIWYALKRWRLVS